MLKRFTALALIAILASTLAACGTAANQSSEPQTAAAASSQTQQTETKAAESSNIISTANVKSGGKLDTTDMFTERDLTQTADLSGAENITLTDGQNVSITKEGVYVLSGSAENVTVTVDAADDAKVQLVLDGVSVTNDDSPVIYVKNADKVFVTSTGENSLSVTGSFTADDTTNTDAVIFSKDDLVLNGTGSLSISSTDNGISCKDDLKITGGTISVECASDALEANESIAVAGGNIRIVSKKDGLHAENDEDDTTGYIYIGGGTVAIRCGDDAIHATSVVQVDGGDLTISAAEGIEATYVQLNGGTVSITSSDDGINAAQKSSAYRATVEINGGDIAIVMGAGDTDGVDSNGDIIVTGGTISVSGNSTFDYDGTAQYTGGTILANGQQIDYIPNQMMGGGMGGWGGFGGGWGGNGGFGGGRRGW